MERPIGANALTDWIIRELRNTPNGVFDALNGRQAANLIGKAIDEQPTIGGWISVKDRTPEISHENPQQGILVVDGNGNVLLTRALLKVEIQGEILIFDDTHSDCFFDLVSGKNPRINTMTKGNHIVYWLPISEPPKEDE